MTREHTSILQNGDSLGKQRGKSSRRGTLWAGLMAVIAGLACAMTTSAHAQKSFPTKPIQLVVGYAAGGPADIISRLLGNKLSEVLGQPVVVENRPGAGGVVASELVSRAASDGHTLLITPIANAVNETLFKSLRAKWGTHLIGVAPVAETANVLVVHPSLDVKSVSDLIARAKAKPDELFSADAGRGTGSHLAMALFNLMAGTKITSVHYKGGSATIPALLSGDQVKVMFSTIPPVLGLVRAGKMRGIATTGKARDDVLPELPTMAEAGVPDYEMMVWFGLSAPAGTPPAVIDRLSTVTSKILGNPDMKAALAKQGFQPMTGSPEQFNTFYRSEVDKWAKVIKATGMDKQ